MAHSEMKSSEGDRETGQAGRKIILLSCSARKLEAPAAAAELYQGTLFRASLEWSQRQSPDAIYILSARHHLLELDAEIDPYDLTFNDLPARQLKDWAGTVMQQLTSRSDPQRDHFVILAGEKYRRYLVPNLKHVSLPLEGLPIGKQVQFLQRQLAGVNRQPEDEVPECERLHSYLTSLPRHQFPFDAATLAGNGIYILFEKGESAHGTDRIVRIGTHRGDGQLTGRLREHFVNENKDRSIFRKNIGRALLNRDDSPLLEQWELDLTTRKAREQHAHRVDQEAMDQIEQHVSSHIHERLSFAVIPVEDRETRMRLETGLIATVNACPRCRPSSNWLGLDSPKPQIRDSGLWLVQCLNGSPLISDEWRSIKQGAPGPTPMRKASANRPKRTPSGHPTGLAGKYSPLTDYLQKAGKDQVTLSLRQLEEILDFSLPQSARKHRPWWANQKAPQASSQSRSWQRAGYAVDAVRTGENGWVRFRRIAG